MADGNFRIPGIGLVTIPDPDQGDRAEMEPKRIQVVRWVCPGCRWSSSRKAVIVDHLTRCWRNPANRACKTCRHHDAGWCCPIANDSCGCGGRPDPVCRVGVPAAAVVDVVVDCPSWESAR